MKSLQYIFCPQADIVSVTELKESGNKLDLFQALKLAINYFCLDIFGVKFILFAGKWGSAVAIINSWN